MAKKVVEKKKEDEVVTGYIIAPRITEKASMQSTVNAYTFIVTQNATKHLIVSEIKKTYKVTPKAVTISNLPGKKKFVRGKFGTTAPTKKAVVFLKKGDSISLA